LWQKLFQIIVKEINKLIEMSEFILQPMVKVNSFQWISNFPTSSQVCKESLELVFPTIINSLKKEHLINSNRSGMIEVSILLTDNKRIQELNKYFSGKNKPTNVLAFPADLSNIPNESNLLVGDIILAWETILNEANRDNKSISSHVSHLLIHGFLHLLGYDHQSDTASKQMENLEIMCLKILKIKNPYCEGR